MSMEASQPMNATSYVYGGNFRADVTKKVRDLRNRGEPAHVDAETHLEG